MTKHRRIAAALGCLAAIGATGAGAAVAADGAALTFRCPEGKTFRTFGVVGNAGFTATSRNYPGHRQTTIVSFAPPQMQHATGTVYAVCR